MQKVRIVCLDNERRSIISALHSIGILDLRRSRLELSDDNAAEHFTALSDMEIRLAGAIALLKRPKGRREERLLPMAHIRAEKLLSELAKLKTIDRIYALNGEKKRLEQALRLLEQPEAVAKELSGIGINLDRLKSERLAFKAYSARNRNSLDALREEIKRRDLAMEAVESQDSKQFSLILAYQKDMDVDSIARKYNLKEIDISLDHIHGTPAEALDEIRKERAGLERGIDSIDRELSEISGREYARMLAFMEMLRIEITKARVSEIFKRTDRTIVIEGWVPAKRAKELEHSVSKACGGRYYMEMLEADELAPTLIKRPKILQPFDYMVSFISVPRSDELDPAIPFIISFPIFYGLMVSDVGYGVLSFFFSMYIAKITNPDGLVHNTAKIWQLSSISAILFGFLSNQYFGLALNHYFTTFVGFDWFKNITFLLLISVIFGIIQVVVGLIFGFINKYRYHRKVAFGRLTSISLIIAGTVAIAGGLFHAFGPNVTLAAGIIAIGSLIATMVLSGEEAGEVTNLISHPLSYARIMGFGLASVVLAFLIDKAFTPSLSLGIPIFILYSLLFLVLHFLNMIVSMFEGAVQGARLNFIEFFTKFYTGGGIAFRPFGAKRIYTKEVKNEKEMVKI